MASQSCEKIESLQLPSADVKSRKRRLKYNTGDSDGIGKTIRLTGTSCNPSESEETTTPPSGTTKTAKITPKSDDNDCSTDKSTTSHSDPYTELKQLQLDLKKEEERLRKLNMVKMYREKNNLEELGGLIDKWRDVGQQSLQDLSDLLPAPSPALKELLDHLQIEYDLLHFDAETDSFS